MQHILHLIEATLRSAEFDPAALRRDFTLGTTDYGELIVADPLGRHLRASSPNVNLYCSGVANSESLRRGAVDLLVGVFNNLPPDIMAEHLFEERFVCVMHRSHPLADGRLTLKRYTKASHLLIAPGGQPSGIVDRYLADQGTSRRVARTVSSFMTAPHMLVNSDLVLTVSERMAQRWAPAFDLTIHKPPLELPSYAIEMAWHRRYEADPENAFLREQLRAVASELAS